MSAGPLELAVAENQERGQWGVMYVRNGAHFAKLGWFDEQADAVKALAEHKATEYAPTPTGPMTKDEAMASLGRIGGFAIEMYREVHAFYTREGWVPLGFRSFAECVRETFPMSRQTAYRAIYYAVLELHLSTAADLPEVVTIGDNFGLTEGAARGIHDQVIEVVGAAVAALPPGASNDEKISAGRDALAALVPTPAPGSLRGTPPPDGFDADGEPVSTDPSVDAGADDTTAGDSAPATDVDTPTPAASTTIEGDGEPATAVPPAAAEGPSPSLIDDGAAGTQPNPSAPAPSSSSSATPPAADLSRSESASPPPTGSPSPHDRPKVKPHPDDALRQKITKAAGPLRDFAAWDLDRVLAVLNADDVRPMLALLDDVLGTAYLLREDLAKRLEVAA